MVWLQIIFFIITNAPSLLKAIREIINIMGNDKEKGKAMLQEMKLAKHLAPMNGKDKTEVMREIMERYKAEM